MNLKQRGNIMNKLERRCLTDGMILQTELKKGVIEISIYAPNQAFEDVKDTIYQRLHDGIEYALAPYWKEENLK
jgi:hypothetical protein